MSTLTVATVKSNSSSPPAFQNTSGTEIGRLCRAFVNFNGTGTIAINSQYNVSSITDNGAGDYVVNFTVAMPDANYATVSTSKWDVGQPSTVTGGKTNNITTSGCSLIVCGNTPDPQMDSPNISFAVFR